MCHLHLKLCTPPCGTVLYTLPELLGILGFEIHHKTERNAARNTDQQIFQKKLGNGLENKSFNQVMAAIILSEALLPGDTRHSHAILSQK